MTSYSTTGTIFFRVIVLKPKQLGLPVHTSNQWTQISAKHFWQHVKPSVGQIYCGWSVKKVSNKLLTRTALTQFSLNVIFAETTTLTWEKSAQHSYLWFVTWRNLFKRHVLFILICLQCFFYIHSIALEDFWEIRGCVDSSLSHPWRSRATAFRGFIVDYVHYRNTYDQNRHKWE